MGIIPKTAIPASDEAIDTIAGIELKRREAEKEAGLAASCRSALRHLHALLDREKEALQLHGPDAGRPANVEAVAAEIERVKKLAAATVQNHPSRHADPAGLRQMSRQKSWQNAQRNPARNKGRRTMGRAGGR
ncbi:MAG TPA: hypothetical protein VFO57_04175 [Burkholderiales bacterium]|nr:hypothetical protein [Burkholderiales bacterium]